MAKVNYAPMEQLSGWLEYGLETDRLEPPVFRCRLRPVTGLNMMDGVGEGGAKLGQLTLEVAIEAVAAWDLEVDGKPVALTPENKMAYMLPIIDQQVAGAKPGVLLGLAILRDARKRENFLKN